MIDPDKVELKAKKFQARLERISRRRFMRMAMLGGAAVAVGSGCGDSNKSPTIKMLDLDTRCRNTRKLFADATINDLFKGKAFKKVLDDHKKNVENDPEPKLKEKVKNLSDELGKVKKDTTLRDLFGVDLDDSALKDLKKSLEEANDYFVVPLLALKDKPGRERAVAFLQDDYKTSTGGKKAQSFVQVFGTTTYGRLMGSDYGINEIQNHWHQHLLREARRIGVLRVEPEVPLDGKGQCAFQDGTAWHCTATGAVPKDWCEITAGGYPSAATNLCDAL